MSNKGTKGKKITIKKDGEIFTIQRARRITSDEAILESREAFNKASGFLQCYLAGLQLGASVELELISEKQADEIVKDFPDKYQVFVDNKSSSVEEIAEKHRKLLVEPSSHI